MDLKVKGIAAVLICLTLMGMWGIEQKYRQEMGHMKSEYRSEETREAQAVSEKLESSLNQIYQGMRTIARLPGVMSIDRHAESFKGDSRTTVQEIYNNLAANVDMSELYIVPADLEPDKTDPLTGKPQAPITTFDSLIVGKSAQSAEHEEEEEKERENGLEEIEIYEYRLMKEQIRQLRAKWPTANSIKGLSYPGIMGPEVITCDNRLIDPKQIDDKKRSGLVYSVPFYDAQGQFKGIISAVFLSESLKRMLPSANYAVVNTSYDYSTFEAGGEAERLSGLVSKAQPNPNAVYSDFTPLSIVDEHKGWGMWQSSPNSHFYDRGDVQKSNQFRILAHLALAGLMILVFCVAFLYEKRQRGLAESNTALEETVRQRTTDLVNARKLEAIGQLASGVAHEINTPAQFIGDNLRFLESGAEHLAEWYAHLDEQGSSTSLEELIRDKAVQRYLREAPTAIRDSLDGTYRINEIVRAMRDYAHPGSSPTTEANINSIISNSVIIARNAIKQTAEVKMDLRESLPSAYCNPGEIGQVFLNLLINACHAIQATDRRDGLIQIKTWNEKDWIVASITDNGSGIPEEIRHRIFDQFFTTKEVGEGTGMGLSIVKHVVEKHGGSLRLKSEVGAGTTFTIRLPRTEPQIEAA